MDVENVQTQTQAQNENLQWLYDLVRYKSLARAEQQKQLEEQQLEQAATIIAETIKKVYDASEFARYFTIDSVFTYSVLLKVIASSKVLNHMRNSKRIVLALARIYNKDPQEIYKELRNLSHIKLVLTVEEEKLKEMLESELLSLDLVEDFRIKVVKLEQLVELLNAERKKNKLIIYIDDKDKDFVEVRLDRLLVIETRNNYDVFVVNKNVIAQLYLFFRRNNIDVSSVLEDPSKQMFLARNPESSRYLKLIEMLLEKAKETAEEREFIKEVKMLKEIYTKALENDAVVAVKDANTVNIKKIDINKLYESDDYVVFTSFLASMLLEKEFDGFSIIAEKKEKMRKHIAGRRMRYTVYFINKQELEGFIDFDKLKEEHAKSQKGGDEAVEEFIRALQGLKEQIGGGEE